MSEERPKAIDQDGIFLMNSTLYSSSGVQPSEMDSTLYSSDGAQPSGNTEESDLLPCIAGPLGKNNQKLTPATIVTMSKNQVNNQNARTKFAEAVPS